MAYAAIGAFAWGMLAFALVMLLAFFPIVGGLLIAFFAICFASISLDSFLRNRLFKRLEGLLPSPAPAEAFAVRVVLRHRGARTGRDDGYATFLDGWLHVERLRTAFSLRACDAGRLSAPRRGGLVLDLCDDQSVEFRSQGDSAVFQEALRIWHYYAIESPEGTPLLPPLERGGADLERPRGLA